MRKVEFNPDYVRAVKLLKTRINTPYDLIRYWAFSGPCLEPHPAIEDISE
jgi:hypothetical protein